MVLEEIGGEHRVWFVSRRSAIWPIFDQSPNACRGVWSRWQEDVFFRYSHQDVDCVFVCECMQACGESPFKTWQEDIFFSYPCAAAASPSLPPEPIARLFSLETGLCVCVCERERERACV